jgi:hypothetical protein
VVSHPRERKGEDKIAGMRAMVLAEASWTASQKFHRRECQAGTRDGSKERTPERKDKRKNALDSDQMLNVMIIDYDSFLDERG